MTRARLLKSMYQCFRFLISAFTGNKPDLILFRRRLSMNGAHKTLHYGLAGFVLNE